jgi:predicted transcriptional regulator of viral defense system
MKQFFETHPVFRYEEFTRFMQAREINKPTTWRQQLSYHYKQGHLLRIRRSLYAVKPFLFSEENNWIDPYLIASKATNDAVLAYHTALELHDLAYTTFEELTYLTAQLNKSFEYQGQKFRPIIFPKSLIAQNKTDYGVNTIKRQGLEIKITSLERTIVDVLDRPDLAGGWEEIWRSLDNIISFDPKKIVKYTLLLNNATTVAKVGFFLEQMPAHIAVHQDFIKQLLPHIPKQPHYMNGDRRGKGKYIEKWQLIVPLEIIERQWEEPNVGDI